VPKTIVVEAEGAGDIINREVGKVRDITIEDAFE
jgi:hypothetical protein